MPIRFCQGLGRSARASRAPPGRAADDPSPFSRVRGLGLRKRICTSLALANRDTGKLKLLIV